MFLHRITGVVIGFFITLSVCEGGIPFREEQNYRIILPENPTKVQQVAANELLLFLRKIYDREIEFNNSKSPLTFFIGVSADAIKAGFVDLPNLKTDFGVFQKGHSLLFYGYDDADVKPLNNSKGYAGTLSAVYYFLNKYVGVNFLKPGKEGYKIVKNKTITFKGEDTPKPSFQVRAVSMRTKAFTHKEMVLFFRRMLGNMPYWASYDYYYIFWKNWKKRFWKSNPEYFMLRDGKRVSEIYPRHIPCLSNPDVIRQTAADVVSRLNSEPAIKTVRLFCDAPIFQCQCKRCSASKARSLAKFDAESGEEFYGFQKKVADIVRQSHPHINFYTQTKGSSYHKPPTLVKLGSFFTVAQLVPRVNPQSNFQFYVDIARKWHQSGVRTILKSYPRYDVKTFANYPIMTPYFTVKYLKMFAGIVEGTKNSELYDVVPYCFSALGQYVQFKALFDINSSADKWVHEFCALAYTGAEVEMVAFYKQMDKLFMKRNSYTGDPLIDAYYPDNLKPPMALLEKAVSKVDKSQNTELNVLYNNFKKFYDHCQKEKKRIDKILNPANLTLDIPFLSVDIKLNTSPATWCGAIKIPFMTPKKYNNFQKSNLYLCCSDNNLYIGLVADEEYMDKLKAENKTTGKGSIWMDDCFEVMLNTDLNSKNYYQLVVNSLGVYRILSCGPRKTAAKMKPLDVGLYAQKNKNTWCVTMKIPLHQFPVDFLEKGGRFNAFRSRYLTHADGGMRQSSGVRLLSTSYHNLYEYTALRWPEAVKK